MSIENIVNSDNRNFSQSGQSGDFLERPRLNKLLHEAINYSLIVVCAGSGYGKTYTLHSFLKKHNEQTLWLQISERDNIPAIFWENYTNMVSFFWPKFGARLKGMGFPDSDEVFSKYAAIRREVAPFAGRKQIRVFDDFHLIHNPSILRFFKRLRSLSSPNITMVLISRTMPEVNMIGDIMRDRMFLIQEEVLCFTEYEIAKYFNQLKLPVTSEDLRNVYFDTEGWAFAINLIGHSLAKKRKYERYALEAMKKNIFRLIEAEIFQTISEPLLHVLLRISLIDHLSVSLIEALAKDNALLREMEQINAYIRYDFNKDTYLIHHLLIDYLRQKQGEILTDEERRETYQTAGKWYDANGYHMDSISYYEKSGDFDSITRKIASLNVQMPYDMAKYSLEIFDRMPDEVKSQNPIFPSMYIKLKTSLGQFEEADVFAGQYAEMYKKRPESPEKNRALATLYAFWGILRMKMCTFTDIYDFDAYFKKMTEYAVKNPFKLIGSYKFTSTTAWASLVGINRTGAMEEFIAAAGRMAPCLSAVLNGSYDGYTELLRGELCFYQKQFGEAGQYFNQALDNSKTGNYFVTQNRALVYLMQIDFFQGDFSSAAARLKKMEEMLSGEDYGVRYTMYDIACCFYRLEMRQPDQVPEWLKSDFSSYTHPSFLENYANRAKAQYHYQTHQYAPLLAFIEKSMEQPVILFGKIELKVLKALSLYRMKQYKESNAALMEAYELADINKIIVPFIMYAKDMRTLTAAALKDKSNLIPKDWLEDINRISSAHAKRKSKIITEYRHANNFEGGINLTDREIAILKALAEGLSRTEIASSRNISINTVKMVVNTIYDKLYVTSLPEAIRAAVDRKII